MAIVRKGIDWRGKRRARSRRGGGPRRVRIALPSQLRIDVFKSRNAPERAGRVERLRRIDAAMRPALHGGMTLGTLAGIDLGTVRLVAQRALLRHAAVRRSGVERLVAPVSVTAR